MKTIKRIKFALLLVTVLTSCMLSAQETIEVDRFQEIAVTGIIDVTLEQGDEEKVVLYNDSGIDRDDIKIKVEQGVLKIRVLKSLIKDHDEIKLEVTYTKIREIKASAGAEVRADNRIVADHLHLRAHSGAEIELDLDVEDLEASTAEGAEIILTGETDSQDVNAASGGEYHAFSLVCNHSYAKANTGGLVEVVAKELIDASANTGGRVKYKGDPAKTKVKDFLGGNIDEM